MIVPARMGKGARFISAKIKAALRGTPPHSAPIAGRLPPGQKVFTNFPVLDLGRRPRIAPAQWRLRIDGDVEHAQVMDWEAFSALPQVDVTADFHCVTRWSRFDLAWRGVALRSLVDLVTPAPAARFVTLRGADDYTTNLPLDVILAPDAVIAHAVDGRPLSVEHGGPVRAVIPARYGWKSAKWLVGIEFHTDDRPGFWETRGYHNEADPWKEQRFG